MLAGSSATRLSWIQKKHRGQLLNPLAGMEKIVSRQMGSKDIIFIIITTTTTIIVMVN